RRDRRPCDNRGPGCQPSGPERRRHAAGGVLMPAIAASIITLDTVLKLVIGAVVAGLGVTLAFSLLIYCADRAATFRRSDRRDMALVFQAASALAVLAIC